jgi:hypothetical protein
MIPSQTPLEWVQLEDSKILEWLSHPTHRLVFEVFVGQALSVKQAAKKLGAKSNSLLYQVGKMLELDMLIEAGVQSTKTRRSILYTAYAREIFVPYVETQSSEIEDFMKNIEFKWDDLFMRQLSKSLEKHPQHFSGILYRREGDKVVRHLSSNGKKTDSMLEPRAPAISLKSGILDLDAPDAKELQQELHDLWLKYSSKRGSRRYLMRLGLTPHEE